MKLGEMLVRDGRIAEADLERVIARQAAEGGRIGSLLVLENLIDVETLTVYLGLELGIPIATGATFERCKRSAVRLMTPENAARYRCIPIVIQGQTLILAVDDPHDLMALDQLAQLTGYRVIPRVAPEIRIYFYLERFYGVPQPRRFAALGQSVRGSTKSTVASSLPAPPLPGLPPRVAAPMAAPVPAPPITSEPPAAGPKFDRPQTPDPEEHEALELEAADLVEELEADEAEVAETAPKVASVTPGPSGRARTSEEIKYEPLTVEQALERINSTEQRSDIADAILGHAVMLFDVATILLVRDNMAFGWKGFGPNLPIDRIETLLAPLEVPSMFQVALHNHHIYRGRAFPSTLHNHWFKVLRTAVPNYSLVLVCAIGNRAVNLLYGHREDGSDLSDEQVAGLQKVLQAAAEAYVRLISASKAQHRAATLAPSFGMAQAVDLDDSTPNEES